MSEGPGSRFGPPPDTGNGGARGLGTHPIFEGRETVRLPKERPRSTLDSLNQPEPSFQYQPYLFTDRYHQHHEHSLSREQSPIRDRNQAVQEPHLQRPQQPPSTSTPSDNFNLPPPPHPPPPPPPLPLQNPLHLTSRAYPLNYEPYPSFAGSEPSGRDFYSHHAQHRTIHNPPTLTTQFTAYQTFTSYHLPPPPAVQQTPAYSSTGHQFLPDLNRFLTGPPSLAASSAAMPTRTFIDLTGSSPPRPSPPAHAPSRQPSRPPPNAEIIDVDSLPDRPPRYTQTPVFSRPRAPSADAWVAPPPIPADQRHGHRPTYLHARNIGNIFDPVLGSGARIGQPIPASTTASAHALHMEIRSQMQARMAHFHGVRPGVGPLGPILSHNTRTRPHRHHPQDFMDSHVFTAPNLDYRMQAGIFQGGAGAGASRAEEYKPPKEPREGFTRSPEEDDVLVCCGCDQELGAESGTPHGEEVWSGKCGHTYCGACALSFKGRQRNGKSNAKKGRMTKTCVVDGCKTNFGTKMGIFKIHI